MCCTVACMMFDFLQPSKKLEKKGKLVVNVHRCPQNHRCPSVQVCSSGALMQKGFAAPVVDYEKCTSCGKCSRFCFPGALMMEKS